VDDSRLWLLVDIPPTRGERPGIGSAVTADIPAAGARVRGTISAILPEADTVSHAARARVVIQNPLHTLAAGMSALVTAAVGRRVPAAVIPRPAVVYLNGRTVVFVPEGESFRAQQVETGAEVGRDEVAVLRGLVGGERVVTVGAQQLANANFNFKGLGEEEDEEAEP
jgi:multidrug efflux pump subunit AcrA (membrane-fusion protein)